MTQDTSSQPFRPTTTFPRNYVVAVINDLHEAEQAVQALQEAGYAPEHVHLLSSQEFITMFTEAQGL